MGRQGANGFDVRFQRCVSFRNIDGKLRVRAKRRGRNEDDASIRSGELVQEFFVSGGELGECRRPVERFHFSELREHDRGLDPGELLRPGREIQLAVLFVNRVTLPGEITEAELFLRGFGGEKHFEKAGLLSRHDLFSTGEGQNVIRSSLEAFRSGLGASLRARDAPDAEHDASIRSEQISAGHGVTCT